MGCNCGSTRRVTVWQVELPDGTRLLSNKGRPVNYLTEADARTKCDEVNGTPIREHV